jgi:hypothetical protein
MGACVLGFVLQCSACKLACMRGGSCLALCATSVVLLCAGRLHSMLTTSKHVVANFVPALLSSLGCLIVSQRSHMLHTGNGMLCCMRLK